MTDDPYAAYADGSEYELLEADEPDSPDECDWTVQSALWQAEHSSGVGNEARTASAWTFLERVVSNGPTSAVREVALALITRLRSS